MSNRWDPVQYAKFADHRSRPFYELLAQVGAEDPAVVVDLGCGNGPLTLALARRWPDARIIGVDNSPQMLAAARELDVDGRVEWVEGDLATWDIASIGATPDVIVSNATLQWVERHLPLIDRWLEALAPGGWFALQVPGNFAAPSHALMREVAATHPRAAELEAALKRFGAAEPATYLQVLARSGMAPNVWETTYHHMLDPEGLSDNPVLDWVRGTGLRPILDALTDPAERAAFVDPYAAALTQAYPRTPAGVDLPFRRVFAVGQKVTS